MKAFVAVTDGEWYNFLQGRPDLEEVILRHGGEAQPSRDAFAQLPEEEQDAVLRFLASLVLFPPDDTASNLDPDSISLRVLFNDPSDPE